MSSNYAPELIKVVSLPFKSCRVNLHFLDRSGIVVKVQIVIVQVPSKGTVQDLLLALEVRVDDAAWQIESSHTR